MDCIICWQREQIARLLTMVEGFRFMQQHISVVKSKIFSIWRVNLCDPCITDTKLIIMPFKRNIFFEWKNPPGLLQMKITGHKIIALIMKPFHFGQCQFQN